MKRRLLSFLIGLVVLLCAVTAFVYAAEEGTAQNVIVLSADTENLTIATDTYIDLNGHSITGITVESGATLYVSDSQTDDFSVADGNYGKLTGITGNVVAADGYMAITEGESQSFHCVDLQICAMSLRPGAAGVYYVSRFAGDEMIAQQVQSFGIALSVAAEPTEVNMDDLCEYSVYSDFSAGTNAATGTLLTGIMSENNTEEENAQNAAMDIYGRAYLKTSEGYLFGSCVTRNLQTQVEAIDGIWTELTDTQKNALLAMYEKYPSVMDQWEIPNIADAELTEKFVSKFRGDFLYRVGNLNAVKVGSLFATADGATVDGEAVTVTVTNLSGTAGATYTAGTTWTDGKLSFTGLGIVEVTVSAPGAIPVALRLEVVEAVNSTGAMSATSSNVVLLNDTGFGSLVVKNGYTLYGNGFKMTCSSDSPALDMGYAFVVLENGNLDNVQIICPNFWYASLYKGNLTSEENEAQVDGTRTRYYNARSAVMASGNNTISNSYISGGRAALYLTAGTTVLDNTTVYGGAAANIHVLAGAGGLVLRDVKLIQEPIRATAKDKTIMGMGVVLMSADDMDTVPPITLEGELIQYAWIDEEDAQYIPEDTSAIVEEVFAQTDFIHTVDGKPSVNLGFVVCPSDDKSTGSLTVNDHRTNKDAVPYGETVLDIVFVGDVTIFSYSNENGTDAAFLSKPEHTPDYNAAPLSIEYTDGNAAGTLTKEYNPVTNAWEYQLVVNLDAGDYSLDFTKLQVLEQGVATAYTVADAEGNAVDTTAQIPLSVGNVSYTLTTVEGKQLRFITVCTREEILPPTLLSANYESGLCVATSYGGTWSGAAPALEGVQIEYYSVAQGGYKTVSLSDCTPTTPGQQNGTNNTWFYEAADHDFTLTLTGGQVHSSNNIFAMPVVCEGKLYFVASSSKGLVNTGNTARTVKVSYVFKDNATNEALTFDHTWSVEENKDEQYQYSNFCNGTLTKLEGSAEDSCVTPDTLVMLADGTQKEIQCVTYEDRLLVWDFYKGEYAVVPSAVIVNHGYGNHNIIRLTFADGTVVKAVNAHAFYDADINALVNITPENAADYIGHRFVRTAENGSYTAVELVDCEIYRTYTESYTLVSAYHYNFIAEGMFSVTNSMYALIAGLEIGEGLKYDRETLSVDIAQYGTYSKEDFALYLSESEYELFSAPYVKISVEKGYVTWKKIIALIEQYLR